MEWHSTGSLKFIFLNGQKIKVFQNEGDVSFAVSFKQPLLHYMHWIGQF